jgi:hypothetical protein
VAAVGALAVLAAGCSSSPKSAHRPAAATTAPAAPTAAPAATAAAAAPACPAGSAQAGAGAAGKADTTPPGDIPDTQAFVAFSPPSGGWRLKVPEGWARRDEPSAVTFTDRLNTIRVEVVAAAAPPTPTSAQTSEVPAIAAEAPCFRPGTVDTVSRAAGQAVHITYHADSAPDPVTGKVVHDEVERYEFWHNGSEAAVTLSSPQGSDNVDPWRTVTDSFAWT